MTPNSNQYNLTFKYKERLRASDFNHYMYKQPFGITSGLTMSLSTYDIIIDTGTCIIQNYVDLYEENLTFNYELTDEILLTYLTDFTNTHNVIVIRMTYQETTNNAPEIIGVDPSSVLEADIVLGVVEFEGLSSTPSGFSYSTRSKCITTMLDDRKNYLQVTPNNPSDTDINISAGRALINGKVIDYAGGTKTLGAVVTSQITYVCLDDTGTIQLVSGTDAGSPSTPVIPNSYLPLARLDRSSGTKALGSEITNYKNAIDMVNNLNTDSAVTFTETVSIDEGKANFVRGATVIVASSDSETSSQNGADYVIDTSADAVLTLGPLVTALNSAGGGEIKLMEGTYNFKTILYMKSNINLIGCGYRTQIIRSAGITHLIDLNNFIPEYCILKDFYVDGNKAVYSGARRGILGRSTTRTNSLINIVLENNDENGFYVVNNCINCVSQNNNSNGFFDCNNLENCIADTNSASGFAYCNNTTNCYSTTNTLDGFNNCIRLNSCESDSNTTDGYETCVNVNSSIATGNTVQGFDNCNYISNCEAEGNVIGFDNCDDVASSYSQGNSSHGYYACESVSASYAYNNGGDGFNACNYVSSCRADQNTSDGFDTCLYLTANKASNNSAHGFASCKAMGFNRALTDTYNACYADFAGLLGTADDADGGFNS